ncbi:MAG TPA: hypothetical protein VGK73_06500, partial [Polyangiaceae bacterium]
GEGLDAGPPGGALSEEGDTHAGSHVQRGYMREASRRVLFTGLISFGTLATWTLLGAPAVGPKPGGAAPKPMPAPIIKLPGNAQKSKVKLVPNLPNAQKTSRTAGEPWFTRPLNSKCVPGEGCSILGSDLGTRAAGQKTPAGMYLSYYPANGGVVTDIKLEAASWSPTLVSFKVPSGMNAGLRYSVVIRNAQGKAASNKVDINVVVRPDPRTNPDSDGDGYPSVAAGGTDCDDLDGNRSPGRTETVDANDVDEDCDPKTYGHRDADLDGVPDVRACNVGLSAAGQPVWYCGSDCDDSLSAVKPDSMVCDPRDTSVIFVCTAKPSWTIDPRETLGSDGFFPPYTCESIAAGARCLMQPNRLGVCQVGAP